MDTKRFAAVLVAAGLAAGGGSAEDLRTAAQDSEPKYILAETRMSGICRDALRALEDAAPSLRFSGADAFLPFPRIEAYLASGRIDAFCGMARTPERETVYAYAETPVYVTYDVLVARADDTVEARSLDDLDGAARGAVFLTAAGVVQADRLKERGLAVDDGAANADAVVMKLLAGRGRFAYQSEVEIVYALRKAGALDKVRVLRMEGTESARYLAFSKSVPASVVAEADAALRRLRADGTLAAVYARYAR